MTEEKAGYQPRKEPDHIRKEGRVPHPDYQPTEMQFQGYEWEKHYDGNSHVCNLVGSKGVMALRVEVDSSGVYPGFFTSMALQCFPASLTVHHQFHKFDQDLTHSGNINKWQEWLEHKWEAEYHKFLPFLME